jgi:hypothetical protein
MWFNHRPEDRILTWRSFRKSLSKWPDEIELVAKNWAQAPLVNHYLCYHDVENWPDPWALIADNLYCDIAVSLGMLYTLHLSDYPHKEMLVLKGFKLKNSHKYYNLLFCEEGKYILNFNCGQVVNTLTISDNVEEVYRIEAKDLKKI